MRDLQSSPTYGGRYGDEAASTTNRAASTDDPEMAQLVEFFIDELSRRVRDMDEAWRDGDADRLLQIAHQLKGAAAAFGFPNITACAAQLEDSLRMPQPDPTQVNASVQALIDLCQSVAR